jgi:pimeloyl-ACP methyl ester carboxylesterase
VSTEGSHELRIHVGQGTELTKKDTMRFIQAVRHAALGAQIMAAALGIAALVLPMTQIASASTAAQPARDHGPKPSIVLVHGAWADSSSWDAFAPAKGQTIGQLVSAQPGSCVLPSANVIAQAYPGAPKGAVDLYVKQSVFPSCMANGLPLGEARTLSATQRPLTSLALTVPSGTPAWKTIPSWAVIGTADHAIPPAELLAMAHQAHARITIAHGAPHLSMIYAPGLVTSVILKAVRATT